MREITVFTHHRPDDTVTALRALIEAAAKAGVTLRMDEEETRKHGLTAEPGIAVNVPVKDEVELCVVLGGDGTILRALQRFPGGLADLLDLLALLGDGALGRLLLVLHVLELRLDRLDLLVGLRLRLGDLLVDVRRRRAAGER